MSVYYSKYSGKEVEDILDKSIKSTDITNVVYLTQSEYDSITPDSRTLYLIPE